MSNPIVSVCTRCGVDPRPVLVNDLAMYPCGLLKDNEQVVLPDGVQTDCLLHNWQRGYIQALRDTREK